MASQLLDELQYAHASSSNYILVMDCQVHNGTIQRTQYRINDRHEDPPAYPAFGPGLEIFRLSFDP